jgi:hypothetical protein
MGLLLFTPLVVLFRQKELIIEASAEEEGNCIKAFTPMGKELMGIEQRKMGY